jgi:hypothetical protein
MAAVSDVKEPVVTKSVRRDTCAVGPWTGAWVGGAVLGIVNGSLREFTYGRRLNEHAAHQVSTGTLILMLMLYMRGLERRWPIGSRRAALRIGGAWALLTVLFEFGFGHFISGKSWRGLLEDYDLTKGRLWSLVLMAMAAGPLVTREVDGSHAARAK